MRMTIALTPYTVHESLKNPGSHVALAAFTVGFHGCRDQQAVQIYLQEVDSNEPGHTVILGTISGRIVAIMDPDPGLCCFALEIEKLEGKGTSARTVALQVTVLSNCGASTEQQWLYFDLPTDKYEQDEGDYWELQLACDLNQALSAIMPVQRVRRQLAVGTQATYDWHDGHSLKLFNDASEDAHGTRGAFRDLINAIKQAQHFIFVADWSFQPYFRIDRSLPAGLPATIGGMLVEKARSGVLVAIHTWDHTIWAATDNDNDSGDSDLVKITMDLHPPANIIGKELAILCGGKRPERLLWMASSRTGVGWSHHQKFVVLDEAGGGSRRRLAAFFGGLDLTRGRFDWPEHSIEDASSVFKHSDPRFNDWYSAEFSGKNDLPRQPWHDIHAFLEGPAAWDFVREFVGRWSNDPSYSDAMGDDNQVAIKKVQDQLAALCDSEKFQQQWEGGVGPFAAQVYRSIAKAHWHCDASIKIRGNEALKWKLGSAKYERSIQDAYLQAISQAERFIYIETQYLIGSGKHWRDSDGKPWQRKNVANQLPEYLTNRILDRIQNGTPFHVYIVTPMFPEGNPLDMAVRAQRQYQWRTQEYMISRLYDKVGNRWPNYLSFYYLAQWNRCTGIPTSGTREERVRASRRYMIYVHSKLMLVDDRYALLGSANLNERSLNGDLDTEICVGLWPGKADKEATCTAQLQAFRHTLWREHLGAMAAGPALSSEPHTLQCVETVRRLSQRNWQYFRQGKHDPQNGHLIQTPLKYDVRGSARALQVDDKALPLPTAIPDGFNALPDAQDPSSEQWQWDGSTSWLINRTDVGE